MFVDITYKQLLAHVSTRWLSLLRVIARILQLWPALVSYFTSHPDSEKHGRVQICVLLNNETKLYLLFLNHLLPTLNAFNVAFQATEYTTIHLLHPEMKRLTKRLLRSFVGVAAIDLEDITRTNHKLLDNQLRNEEIKWVKLPGRLLSPLVKRKDLKQKSSCFSSMSAHFTVH